MSNFEAEWNDRKASYSWLSEFFKRCACIPNHKKTRAMYIKNRTNLVNS